jgi:hypothetical protein
LPEPHRFRLSVSGAATITWNGEPVGESAAGPWHEVTWDADVRVGINDLTVVAAPGAAQIGDIVVGFP